MKHCLALAAVLVAGPASAGDDEVNFLVGLWPAAESCPPEISVEVSLEAVLAAPRAYANQCVTIKGYASHRALFADPDDMAVRYASSNSQIKGRRIGISASDDIHKKLADRYSREYVELRGKVWMCEDNGPWLGGYCHYTSGPFIGVVSAKAVREPMRYRREWE
jgi:hypothetical protein